MLKEGSAERKIPALSLKKTSAQFAGALRALPVVGK